MDKKKEASISIRSLTIDDSQLFKTKILHEDTILLDLTEKITKHENREWR